MGRPEVQKETSSTGWGYKVKNVLRPQESEGHLTQACVTFASQAKCNLPGFGYISFFNCLPWAVKTKHLIGHKIWLVDCVQLGRWQVIRPRCTLHWDSSPPTKTHRTLVSQNGRVISVSILLRAEQKDSRCPTEEVNAKSYCSQFHSRATLKGKGMYPCGTTHALPIWFNTGYLQLKVLEWQKMWRTWDLNLRPWRSIASWCRSC